MAPAFPSPTLKSLDILFVPIIVTVGLINTGGVAVLDVFQRLVDLCVSPTPVGSHLSIAQAADLHPDCCGGVRLVEVFPGMQKGANDGWSNTTLKVALG